MIKWLPSLVSLAAGKEPMVDLSFDQWYNCCQWIQEASLQGRDTPFFLFFLHAIAKGVSCSSGEHLGPWDQELVVWWARRRLGPRQLCITFLPSLDSRQRAVHTLIFSFSVICSQTKSCLIHWSMGVSTYWGVLRSWVMTLGDSCQGERGGSLTGTWKIGFYRCNLDFWLWFWHKFSIYSWISHFIFLDLIFPLGMAG